LWRDEVCCGGIRSPSVLPSRLLNPLLTPTVIGSPSLRPTMAVAPSASPTETSTFARRRSGFESPRLHLKNVLFCRINVAKKSSGEGATILAASYLRIDIQKNQLRTVALGPVGSKPI
jgi:hypothetical protein